MTEHTDKERYESAEALLKKIGYFEDVFGEPIDAHFAKYTKPDPDKELWENWEALGAWGATYIYGSGEEGAKKDSFKKAIELNLLATAEHDNKVSHDAFQKVIKRFQIPVGVDAKFSAGEIISIILELRTKYQTLGGK